MMGNSTRLTRRGAVRGVATLLFLACAWLTVWPEPEWLQKGFVLTLMLCVTGVILCASARLAFALLLGGGAFAALRFISDLKLRYLDTPLMPADFVYYLRSSLLATLRHYPHLYLLSAGVVLGAPLLLLLAWRLDGRLFASANRGRTLARSSSSNWLEKKPSRASCSERGRRRRAVSRSLSRWATTANAAW